MVVFLMETNANTSYRNRIKGRGVILWKGSGGGGHIKASTLRSYILYKSACRVLHSPTVFSTSSSVSPPATEGQGVERRGAGVFEQCWAAGGKVMPASSAGVLTATLSLILVKCCNTQSISSLPRQYSMKWRPDYDLLKIKSNSGPSIDR